MNVIRNVLLVPPPAMTSAQNKHQNAETEENTENKYLEISRDPALLEKHGVKVNLSQLLDLSHRHSREEVKIYIEESLNNVLELHPGTARFVEVSL